MINKEMILNADGSIKKDFSDRTIPQNSNNQVSVNVLIPSTCFTGLQNYAVLLAVSRIIGNSETTLNTLVMSVSKSITIDGVVYVKYTAYLTSDYTDKLGQLKFSPYIQTTTTITEDDETSEVISIQQAFTNSNLNVIKSVLPQYDASLEEGTIATTLETQINGKKIYNFIDDATSDGEHYYNLVDGFNPSVDQFKGCLVVSVYNGATTYIMPYSNDGVELLEITSDGVFNRISNVSYANSTYTYTKQKLTYTKSEIDTALNLKVDKAQKVNGHALIGDITLTKGDVGLGNVENYGVESTPTAVGDDLYITSKGVYDALQLVYTAISGCATDEDLTTINNRLNSIEAIIGSDDGDADNVINTLKEVIVVLNGLGEGASLLDLINAKANQSDFNTLNSQINGENGIATKVSFLYDSNHNAYAEIKAQSGTIDILTSDWVANTGDANYPYKWELSNGYLIGCNYASVVFDKDSDTSMISTSFGIDDENGKVIIYASELPSATISIQLIAIFNSVNAYELYNQTLVSQVNSNTQAISDINNTKLPQYVKTSKEYELINGGTANYEIKYRDGSKTMLILSVVDAVDNNDYVSHSSSSVEFRTDGLEIKQLNGLIQQGNQKSIDVFLKDGLISVEIEESGTTHALTFDANGDLKIDGNAVGGGKQLYQHNILLTGSVMINGYDRYFRIPITITNDSNLPFVKRVNYVEGQNIDLFNWFSSKGLDGTTAQKSLAVCGFSIDLQYLCYGVGYSETDERIRIMIHSDSSFALGNTTIIDNVESTIL